MGRGREKHNTNNELLMRPFNLINAEDCAFPKKSEDCENVPEFHKRQNKCNAMLLHSISIWYNVVWYL